MFTRKWINFRISISLAHILPRLFFYLSYYVFFGKDVWLLIDRWMCFWCRAHVIIVRGLDDYLMIDKYPMYQEFVDQMKWLAKHSNLNFMLNWLVLINLYHLINWLQLLSCIYFFKFSLNSWCYCKGLFCHLMTSIFYLKCSLFTIASVLWCNCRFKHSLVI